MCGGNLKEIMDNKLRIERLKQSMGCKTNVELAEKLKVDKSTITRWAKDGFSKSIQKIIDFLLIKS
jgi:hypothetical protein